MSAVSKWLMPASMAASTTANDRSSSMRIPKLLQPSPASDTSTSPILRVAPVIAAPVVRSSVCAPRYRRSRHHEPCRLPAGTVAGMAPPRSLAPLRHRRFALLWTGAFVSNIGTWMETVGVGILVTSHTGKAGWAGLVAAAAFVPTALLAPFGGAIADRFPRRTVLVTTTLLQTSFAGSLTLLAATGTPSPGVVTLIVLGAGCANAIGFPSFQALLPDLVPRDELAGAIALTSAQWNLGRVIGPALAGVAIGLDGYELAFGINTLSFFAVLAVVASFQLPKPAPAGDTSILGSIREGARFVRSDPALRIVVAFMACNSLLAAPFIALVPAVALKV